MKIPARIVPFILSLASLLLSACGTLQVSVYSTPTPDVTMRQTIDALAVQNAVLAAGAVTQTAETPQIGLDASSEEIRAHLLTSHRAYQTAWSDGEIRLFGPDPLDTDPIQVTRFQAWVDQPGERFRLLSGPAGQIPGQVTIFDGSRLSTWSFPSGQVETYSPENASPENYQPGAAADTVQPHPFSLLMGLPVGDALFPAPLAQRTGTFVAVRPESAAGRPALVVDWLGEAGARVDRFWVDVETGVVLRWQNFTKEGGEEISSEIEIQSILYDSDLPAQMFIRQLAEVPGYSDDPSGTPTQADAQKVSTPVPGSEQQAGEITFAVRDNVRKRITLVRLAGQCLVERSVCPAVEEVPGYPNRLLSLVDPLAWSADGELAALVSGERSYGIPARLYVFERSTEKWTELYEADAIYNPTWSADGLHIAAAVASGGRIDLVVFSLEGSKPENLTSGSYSREEANLFPVEWLDANTLLFSLTEGTSTSIYVVDIRSGEKSLAVRVEGKAQPPVLSPDGLWLAGVTAWDTSSQLELSSLDGSETHTLASFQFSTIQQVTWSPDGSRLAFTAQPGGTSNSVEVYTLQRDGTGLQQVFRGMMVGELVWSPDEQHLLVAGQDEEGHYYLYHADLAERTTEILQAEGLRLDQDWLAPAWHLDGG